MKSDSRTSSVFHTASALSAPTGTFPSRGRLNRYGEAATATLKFESGDWVYETLPRRAAP